MSPANSIRLWRRACVAALLSSCAAAWPATATLCLTDFPPYVDPRSQDGGPWTRFATAALKEAGFDVAWEVAPWSRAYSQASRGECLLLALWRTPERDALFAYTQPVAMMALGLFVPAARATPLDSQSVVAYERGAYLPASIRHRYRWQEVTRLEQALEMLALGRVEGVFMEKAAGEFLMSSNKKLAGRLRWQEPAVESVPTFMAIGRHSVPGRLWLDAIDRALAHPAPRAKPEARPLGETLRPG